MEKLKAFLLSHGVPQDTVDKLAAVEGHAAKIALMVVEDGKAAAEAFINAEYAKVVAALKP